MLFFVCIAILFGVLGLFVCCLFRFGMKKKQVVPCVRFDKSKINAMFDSVQYNATTIHFDWRDS